MHNITLNGGDKEVIFNQMERKN